MANFNKIILLGNVTKDPEMSYLPSQIAVVNFGIAVNRKWKNKEGVGQTNVCFVDLRCFGKQAETIHKYVKKGDLLFVEGRLEFNSWVAKDNSKRSKHRVTIESFQLMPNGQPVDAQGQETAQTKEDKPRF